MAMGQGQVHNQPAVKIVTVGSKQYEITGWLLGGARPVWHFIRQDGKPMTHELFNALPDADKKALADHVKRHVEH